MIIIRRNHVLIVLLTVNFIFCEDLQCEYESCNDDSRPGQYIQHTMCQYPPGPTAQCMNVTHNGLSDSEETMILNLHNELRKRVASGNETRSSYEPLPPGNIPILLWDAELAEIAQRWAEQCVYQNDMCRKLGGYNIGQNIGYIASLSQNTNFSVIIEEWLDEVQNLRPRIIEKFRRRERFPIDHYTQMIWGNTTHVGCGGVKYINSRHLHTAHFVCNYRPEGNINNDAVYEILRRK